MIKIPEELLKKLDELIEKLASNGGGNVQIAYMGYSHENLGGLWGFIYDGNLQGPYKWEDLEAEIDNIRR